MARFILFFSYTAEAMRSMIHHPSDRSAAAKALVESLGGKLEAYYWMHGNHDGFLIAELPDGVSTAALAAVVGSTGALVGLETHEVFDHHQQASIMEKARTALAAYSPPTTD